MDKTAILETLFETIEGSLDLGLGSKDDKYSFFINGAIDIANRLMDKIETTEDSPSTVQIGSGLGKKQYQSDKDN